MSAAPQLPPNCRPAGRVVRYKAHRRAQGEGVGAPREGCPVPRSGVLFRPFRLLLLGTWYVACVVGGVFLPLQGMLAGKIGYLGSYWFTIALFAYVFVYANFLSKPKARAE